MTYTNESHIKSVKDVETFFHHIAQDGRPTPAIHPSYKEDNK